MRRTENDFTTEQKAMMLDILLDFIEDNSEIDIKSMPVEFKKDSRAGFIGYGIKKTLVDNGFLEAGTKKAQRSFV